MTANAPPPHPLVTFDEFSKLRILDPSQFEASEQLKEECQDFTTRTGTFNDIIQMFMRLMDEKAGQIEREKLHAIGLRNRAERQAEGRKRTHGQMQALIKERQAELDRLILQAESLQKVQQEQASLIDSMSSK
ncbi:Intraflagellar transport protein 20 [Geranomyces michiganensis]|nr:Intraflagellar transport protein 20 [Geranomyces michiganensis]